MIANCETLNITMLRWIAFIRMFNLELRHISRKNNAVADMLSRARYHDVADGHTSTANKGELIEEDEELEFRMELYSEEFLTIRKYL